MRIVCSAVHVALETVGSAAISGPIAVHVERCEACGNDLAEYAMVGSVLASLGPDSYVAPARLRAEVMSSLGPVVVPDLESHTSLAVPVAAAAVVATAAAGTAVLIALRRQSVA